MLEAHTSILLQQQADVRLTMRTGIKREGLTMSYCRGDHSLERDETYFNHREAFVLRLEHLCSNRRTRESPTMLQISRLVSCYEGYNTRPKPRRRVQRL